jgi:hypothetical protein
MTRAKIPQHQRGPTSRRGLQYAQTPLPELTQAFNEATARLRALDNSKRTRASGIPDPVEAARRRKEVVDLLTDLRAELRRRGEP